MLPTAFSTWTEKAKGDSMTTPVREQVLQFIRKERERQVHQYGLNDDLLFGFGEWGGHPWMAPYSYDSPAVIEAVFRLDYEQYEHVTGKPTWMHLIREEVAELFETTDREHTISEAVQVAALCVSLVELLVDGQDVTSMSTPLPISDANRRMIEKAYDSGEPGSTVEFSVDPDLVGWVVASYEGTPLYYGREIDGVLYSAVPASGGGLVSVLKGSEILDVCEVRMFHCLADARRFVESIAAQ